MKTAELGLTAGLNADGFASFQNFRSGETQWQADFRKRSWDLYQKLPMPNRKDEEWRRVDLRAIRLDEIVSHAPSDQAGKGLSALPASVRARIDLGPTPSGLIVQHNSEDVHAELDPELQKKGVICCGLDHAVRTHPDLVRQYYGTIRPATDGKFVALHYAFQSGGTFLYIPPDVHVEIPIRSLVFSDADGVGLFPHTLIVLDRGASLNYFEERFSAGEGGRQNLVAGVTEAHLAAGAKIRLMSMQDFDHNTFNFTSEKTIGNADANIAWLTADFGGQINKGFIDCDLLGRGGRCEILGLYYMHGRQQSDMVTLLTHKAPHTEGNILYKGVCDDFARTGFRGRIVVQKEANQTQSFLADHTMLLSDKARSDSVPTLEIEANDVICKHAATIGQISDEELFYLRSRGIPEGVARKMIILGFYEEVLKSIPASLQERVRRSLQAKFEFHEH